MKKIVLVALLVSSFMILGQKEEKELKEITIVNTNDVIAKNILDMKELIKSKRYSEFTKYISYKSPENITIYQKPEGYTLNNIMEGAKNPQEIEKKVSENIRGIMTGEFFDAIMKFKPEELQKSSKINVEYNVKDTTVIYDWDNSINNGIDLTITIQDNAKIEKALKEKRELLKRGLNTNLVENYGKTIYKYKFRIEGDMFKLVETNLVKQ